MQGESIWENLPEGMGFECGLLEPIEAWQAERGGRAFWEEGTAERRLHSGCRAGSWEQGVGIEMAGWAGYGPRLLPLLA